ncbi:hypothetical protein BDW02DRAFT_192492 [Decorospora gaudefroyi]|uniref:Uncharacterized protein n=1 Tax=Decorospora gaudefroyi TaxID=184978 RepID=A0A6A5K3U0_9PLEO|nr:hypothetical protein BDW02DRAFT_192492 [Decorospora gaudefroyi]
MHSLIIIVGPQLYPALGLGTISALYGTRLLRLVADCANSTLLRAVLRADRSPKSKQPSIPSTVTRLSLSTFKVLCTYSLTRRLPKTVRSWFALRRRLTSPRTKPQLAQWTGSSRLYGVRSRRCCTVESL